MNLITKQNTLHKNRLSFTTRRALVNAVNGSYTDYTEQPVHNRINYKYNMHQLNMPTYNHNGDHVNALMYNSDSVGFVYGAGLGLFVEPLTTTQIEFAKHLITKF